jgi:hypothetical protein
MPIHARSSALLLQKNTFAVHLTAAKVVLCAFPHQYNKLHCFYIRISASLHYAQAVFSAI